MWLAWDRATILALYIVLIATYEHVWLLDVDVGQLAT